MQRGRTPGSNEPGQLGFQSPISGPQPRLIHIPEGFVGYNTEDFFNNSGMWLNLSSNSMSGTHYNTEALAEAGNSGAQARGGPMVPGYGYMAPTYQFVRYPAGRPASLSPQSLSPKQVSQMLYQKQ